MDLKKLNNIGVTVVIVTLVIILLTLLSLSVISIREELQWSTLDANYLYSTIGMMILTVIVISALIYAFFTLYDRE